MNILYFITHDTGRFLGTYGRPIPFSPHLDAFAAQGVQFNQAFCSAPCCGPSRNCAMTGKYSHVTGALGLGGMGWTLPLKEQTTVDYLNDAGYETVHIGFCHERLYGEMRYQIDGEPGNERYWSCDARNVVDCAIEYLRERDNAKPFYLNLATNETHASHLRGVATERHGGPVEPDLSWVPPTEPECAETRTRWAHFYASLQYVDHHFGRLMATLDELQLRDDTLCIYTTDHGTGCLRGKGHVYEPGVEIALLVRPPKGYRTGYQVDCLTPNIDFLPTILEAAGRPVPQGINGRSLWPLIADQTYQPREQVFIERNFHGERAWSDTGKFVDKYDPQRIVRTRDFAYVRHCRPDVRKRPWYKHEVTGFNQDEGFQPSEDQQRPREELYDLRHDPWEQTNLAERGEYREVQMQLAARLEKWMRETDDPALKPEMPLPLDNPVHWPTRDNVVEVEHC